MNEINNDVIGAEFKTVKVVDICGWCDGCVCDLHHLVFPFGYREGEGVKR